MKMSLKGFFCFCIIVNLFGCAGLLGPRPTEPSLSQECQERALIYEKKGELQKALYQLKIADALDPGNDQLVQRIVQLKADIANRAVAHFKRGVALYKKGDRKSAQKEFLIALRYNPHHHEALDYFKNRPADKGFISYRVKKGDTFKTIASFVYKDPDMDFLVASLLNLSMGGKPLPGSVINLPVFRPDFKRPSMDVKARLSEARSFFKTKEYEKVLPTVLEILSYDPENKEAAELKNVSCFRMGKRLVLKRNYFESLDMFNKVDPGYDGIKEAIAEVKGNITRQAEMHYRKGIKFFLSEDLEKAIMEWKRTLAHDPDHQKAKRDMEEAQRLLIKLEQIK